MTIEKLSGLVPQGNPKTTGFSDRVTQISTTTRRNTTCAIMSIVDGVPVAMAPPAGYVVDFEHPQRQTVGATYAVIGVGNVLALLFLAQRFFVKLKVRHKVGIDDGMSWNSFRPFT